MALEEAAVKAVSTIFTLTLDEKLYANRYEVDTDHPHIQVDRERCRGCQDKVCLRICPAGVYTQDPNDPRSITVSHENCLECGSCRIVCTEEGVRWEYPRGGRGIKYRFG